MDIDYDEVYTKVLYDPPRPCSCGGNCQCKEPETVKREWGHWKVLATEEGYKVKELVIQPGQEISRQFHNYRSETWNIIEGVGVLELGHFPTIEREHISKGETFTIKKKEVHKVINTGETNLVAIEVQMGERTEEDDIVRL
jgi:mannose-6-phosphate isomerase-like protein (cupin superfamily)